MFSSCTHRDPINLLNGQIVVLCRHQKLPIFLLLSFPWFLILLEISVFFPSFLCVPFLFFFLPENSIPFPCPTSSKEPSLSTWCHSNFLLLLSQLFLGLSCNLRQMMFIYSSFITNLTLKGLEPDSQYELVITELLNKDSNVKNTSLRVRKTAVAENLSEGLLLQFNTKFSIEFLSHQGKTGNRYDVAFII